MKVHQNKVHQVTGNDASAKAVIEDEEFNSDYDKDDFFIGGAQVLIAAIEEEASNEALVAYFDKEDMLEEAQVTEKAYYSMVSHVITSSFFANKVSPCEPVKAAEVIQKETHKCEECVKLKEVEENQEELLKKSDKDIKALEGKMKSMAGQKRFHVNKSKALEKEVESTRMSLSEMQKRISILEIENLPMNL